MERAMIGLAVCVYLVLLALVLAGGRYVAIQRDRRAREAEESQRRVGAARGRIAS
jgi:hypothetical protein